jgi:predicted amidohydrolase
MSQILDLLRPGDVLTHAYSGAPNLSNQFTNIVQDGRLTSRRRGTRSASMRMRQAASNARVGASRSEPGAGASDRLVGARKGP